MERTTSYAQGQVAGRPKVHPKPSLSLILFVVISFTTHIAHSLRYPITNPY